jgi:glycosyltransferase involved in cell wall biosynthesis
LLSRISDLRKRKLQNLANKFSARIRFENGVTDEQYYQWLYRAKALVSASLDEGFGIPVVEAMARGCPVVLSDIQIFEEVAGPAGLRFAPFSEIGFAEQIKRLSDKNTWKLQSALGLDQAQFFTWQDSAELLIELAEELTT